jgi:glycerol-3-phosphate acyltransferase PlsY
VVFLAGCLSIVAGYLLGSINSAMIICKLMGLPSPRSIGSGNPGATNVLRLGSKKAAALTLIGDAVKGFVPVLVAHFFHLPMAWICLVALAAVIGHIFPLFFGFKGGKGVATGLGVLLGIQPLLGLAVLVTWLVVAGITRYSSLAALISVILTPFYGYFLLDKNLSAVGVLVLIALLILARHHANIKRLFQGKESKIFKK